MVGTFCGGRRNGSSETRGTQALKNSSSYLLRYGELRDTVMLCRFGGCSSTEPEKVQYLDLREGMKDRHLRYEGDWSRDWPKTETW